MGITKAALLSQVLGIRAAAETFCVDTIALYSRTGDTVSNGESTPTYATAQDIPARVINRSGASRTQETAQYRSAQQTFYDTQYRVQLPYGTVIKVNDRLHYSDRATGKVVKLEVVYVPIQHDFMGAFVIGANEIM
jgi:hypothetical protein